MILQLCRFLAVTVLGALLDFGLGLALVKFAGMSTELASVCGFAAALVFNFALHARWTFSDGGPPGQTPGQAPGQTPGLAQAAGYLASCAVTLAVRLATLRLAAAASLPYLYDRDAERLALAFGLSFLVNFAICRGLVFRRNACGPDPRA